MTIILPNNLSQWSRARGSPARKRFAPPGTCLTASTDLYSKTRFIWLYSSLLLVSTNHAHSRISLLSVAAYVWVCERHLFRQYRSLASDPVMTASNLPWIANLLQLRSTSQYDDERVQGSWTTVLSQITSPLFPSV